jgi:hypothetical protein
MLRGLIEETSPSLLSSTHETHHARASYGTIIDEYPFGKANTTQTTRPGPRCVVTSRPTSPSGYFAR